MANLGNTCYMAAVLQALLRLPSFVEGLRARLTELPPAPAEAGALELLESLVEILDQLQSASVVDLTKLKTLVAQRSPQFAGHGQVRASRPILPRRFRFRG